MEEIPQYPIIGEYQINPLTMLVLPKTYGCKTYSLVFEVHKTFLCPVPPKNIIQTSCKFYGVSYEGRVAGTKQIIGKINKAPLTIDSRHSIYFFPTKSPQNSSCMWVSNQHVEKFSPINSKTINITFLNKLEYEVPMSSNSFESQKMRTFMLRMELLKRIEEAKKRTDYANLKYHLKVAENGYYDSDSDPDSNVSGK